MIECFLYAEMFQANQLTHTLLYRGDIYRTNLPMRTVYTLHCFYFQRMKLYFLNFIFLISFCACTNLDDKNKDKSRIEIPVANIDSVEVQPKVDSIIHLNPYYNDISLFIAGLPIDSLSRFINISKSSEFIEYGKTIEKTFSRFRRKKMYNLELWRDSTLNDINATTEDVLYPFSGPDIIYAYSILPKARNYYLFGLEPVGIIPNIENYNPGSLPTLFKSINTSISDNLNLSFFITKKMKVELSAPEIKGTVPILLFFMSRMNLHIQDIVPVSLDEDGSIVRDINGNGYTTTKTFKNGVDITFIRPNENKLSHVYYFSLNINNSGFVNSPQLGLFINSLNNKTTTLVKSSSYCMHTEKYSTIRDLLLNKSDNIIEDDSGIPYALFNQNVWDINLYGSYSKPVDVFESFMQEDYKTAFQESSHPINFRFGYSYPSNILVSRKKTQ